MGHGTGYGLELYFNGIGPTHKKRFLKAVQYRNPTTKITATRLI